MVVLIFGRDSKTGFLFLAGGGVLMCNCFCFLMVLLYVCFFVSENCMFYFVFSLDGFFVYFLIKLVYGVIRRFFVLYFIWLGLKQNKLYSSVLCRCFCWFLVASRSFYLV